MPSQHEEKVGQPYRVYKVAESKSGKWSDALPSLSNEEYASLKNDIEKNGVLVPIMLEEDEKTVLEGHHRLQVCHGP